MFLCLCLCLVPLWAVSYFYTYTHTNTQSATWSTTISLLITAQWVMSDWQPTASFSVLPLTLTSVSCMYDGVPVTVNSKLCFFVPLRAAYDQMYHLSTSQIYSHWSSPQLCVRDNIDHWNLQTCRWILILRFVKNETLMCPLWEMFHFYLYKVELILMTFMIIEWNSYLWLAGKFKDPLTSMRFLNI